MAAFAVVRAAANASRPANDQPISSPPSSARQNRSSSSGRALTWRWRIPATVITRSSKQAR